MAQLRKLERFPMSLEGITYDLGERPTLTDIKLEHLWVDETYQRTPSGRGIKLIKKMVARWDWRLFKSPIVVRVIRNDEERFMVVDGQHTIIAAITRGDIESLPVLLFNETSTRSQAMSFVGHNTQRTSVRAARLFYSKVEAGDPAAIDLNEFMKELGVYFVDTPKKELGEIAAPQSFATMYRLLTQLQLQTIVQVCLRAQLKPIFKSALSLANKALWTKTFGDLTTMEVVTALAALDLRDDVSYSSRMKDLEIAFVQEIRKARSE